MFHKWGFEKYASRDYGKTLNVCEECLSFFVSGPDEGESFVKGSVRADERQLGVYAIRVKDERRCARRWIRRSSTGGDSATHASSNRK